MKDRSRLILAVLALGFAAASPAAAQHSHEGRAAPPAMTLDHGRKWPTDEVLRAGMAGVREDMASALESIHAGRFDKENYAVLARSIQGRLDEVVANCKLPEAADQQLHVALSRMLGGVAAMKTDASPDKGAVAIVEALNAYGEHFDHPGWTLLPR